MISMDFPELLTQKVRDLFDDFHYSYNVYGRIAYGDITTLNGLSSVHQFRKDIITDLLLVWHYL